MLSIAVLSPQTSLSPLICLSACLCMCLACAQTDSYLVPSKLPLQWHTHRQTAKCSQCIAGCIVVANADLPFVQQFLYRRILCSENAIFIMLSATFNLSIGSKSVLCFALFLPYARIPAARTSYSNKILSWRYLADQISGRFSPPKPALFSQGPRKGIMPLFTISFHYVRRRKQIYSPRIYYSPRPSTCGEALFCCHLSLAKQPTRYETTLDQTMLDSRTRIQLNLDITKSTRTRNNSLYGGCRYKEIS